VKIIKAIMVFVLLALVASIFPYLNSTDNTVTSNTPSKADKDKKINKEYKINQDDKDSVVESNRLVLSKLNALENDLNDLKVVQKQQGLAIQKGKNISHSGTKKVVSKVMSMLNLKNKLNDRDYKIKNSDMSIHGKVKYTWTESLRSGVLNEDGNFVHIYETTRQDLNNDNNIIGDPVTDDEATLKPVYTIPTNSILSGRLITGLVGRIPLDGQVTDPFRFSIKIINKSFYANRHANNVLQDVIASGTASGDLRLSCVRASIDSITFIFEDGTISDHKISDIGFITNEYGFPCVKGIASFDGDPVTDEDELPFPLLVTVFCASEVALAADESPDKNEVVIRYCAASVINSPLTQGKPYSLVIKPMSLIL
jgi:integrating conjugative element protein (TIGR03752 family)